MLEVGGLRVIDRALRQLARAQVPRVVIATDGAIALPKWLAPTVEVRPLSSDDELPARLQGLEAELGQPLALRADVVRVRANHYDGGLRVVDEPSRVAAEDAIFKDLLRGDLGLVARHINKKVSFWITRRYLLPLADHAEPGHARRRPPRPLRRASSSRPAARSASCWASCSRSFSRSSTAATASSRACASSRRRSASGSTPSSTTSSTWRWSRPSASACARRRLAGDNDIWLRRSAPARCC